MRFILIGLLVFLLVYADSTDVKTTMSNVTVSTYVSISLSSGLSSGVQFGNLGPGQSNQSATTCENLACNISVSADTNVNVDIVMMANANLTRGASNDTIPAWAYTWNSSINGTFEPSLPGFALNVTGYDYTPKLAENLAPNSSVYWSAWLNIPSDQASGSYNNTLYFCAERSGYMDC